MTESIEAVAAEIVGGDVPCRKCGYNLRGLAVGGRCPECGTLVGLSVRGDLLRYSDPGWLGGLVSGVRFIIWGVVAVIVAVVVGIVLRGWSPLAVELMSLGAHGLILWGWWLMTRPDPSGLGEGQYGTARRWIRIGLIGGAVSVGTGFVARQTIGWPREMSLVVGGIGQLAGLVGLFAELQYLKKIARRIPDDKLEGRAEALTYWLGGSYAMVVVMGLVMVAAGRGGSMSGVSAVAGCGAGVGGLVAVVGGIFYLLMLERFGKRFKEQAGLAREAWGGGGGREEVR